MRLIILEGVDKTGKTTLAKALEDKNLEKNITMHWPAPPKELAMPIYEYFDERMRSALSQVNMQNMENFIWDRSPIGNMLYGPLKKDQQVLTFEEILRLFKDLSKLFDKVDVYLLQASYLELKKRNAVSPDPYVTVNEAHGLQKRYNEMFFSLATGFKAQSIDGIRMHVLPKNISTEDALTRIKI